MTPKHPDLIQIEDMLHVREARVVGWSLAARLAFFGLFIILILLHLTGLIRPGIAAESDTDAQWSLTMLTAASICIAYGLFLVRRRKHLLPVGLGAVLLDILLLACLPMIWYSSMDIPDGSPVFLMKNELFTLGIVVIVVNSMALRPLYPAVMAAGLIAIHLIIMQFVLTDPRVVIASGYIEHFYTSAVNPGIFTIRIIVLFTVGGFLSFLAWLARRNIQDAVNMEIVNFEIKEQQAELLYEGRMVALSGLVAGITHEINNPLGVVKSGLDTLNSSASKLIGAMPETADRSKTDRILQVIKHNGTSTGQAIDRITKLVGSLKDFSRLDEAEVQLTDLHDDIDTTLSLIDMEKRDNIEIIKTYGDLPEFTGRPKELNQVFMTIFVNAFEAMDSQGTLHIKTDITDAQVTIEITDTGPGISETDLSQLFEIGFTAGRNRVSMGLGLPMAYRIVKRHNGDLSVQSTSGSGTTFLISLPVQPTVQSD